MGLKGHFVAIAGSVAENAQVALLRRSHAAVRELTRSILRMGGGIATTVGAEARLDQGDPDTARVFFWTILDEVAAFARVAADTSAPVRTLATIVCSERAIADIPAGRQPLWKALLDSRQVELKSLNTAWSAGAYVRQHQARAGDALVVLGGGEGVEHLASLYVERGRPVIPLDPELGSFSGDGRGGAAMLFTAACSSPERFVIDPALAKQIPTELRRLSLQRPDADPVEVARELAELLDRLVVFRAFFIRLMNPAVSEFLDVEGFFSEVATPCVRERGYEEDQIGLKPATEALVNREIFERLHHADVVIADLTALRPNNFLELGYALGRPIKTIITVKEGTSLPFDTQAMPVHFWRTDLQLPDRKRLFQEWWTRYVDRPPLVRPRELG